MKRILFVLAALFSALSVSAQTAEEILENMEKAMEAGETQGMVMTIDIKMPVIGTISSKSYSRGDKVRMESTMMGVNVIAFTNGDGVYTYNSADNTVTIENLDLKPGEKAESDAEMFEGIGDGYNCTVTKETDTAWYITCKKDKSNKDKDAPKSMDVVVAKGSFLPISLSTSSKGTRITMRDIKIGVEESFVTYNPADYPDAKVVDKRKK